MDQSNQNTEPIKNKWYGKWFWKIFLSVFLFIFMSSAYFGYTIWEGLQESLGQAAEKSRYRDNKIEIEKDPFSVLFIGIDSRTPNTNEGRADVLILATINPLTKSIKAVSIPRDSYVRIANTNIKTKINAAGYHGYINGIDPYLNIKETVEDLLHIPIDYYAKINFHGFISIVDTLGGVDVNVQFPFKSQAIGGRWISFEPGNAHLDGSEALAYVRNRKNDKSGENGANLGDHGRNIRQQEVLSNIMDKFTSLNGLTNLVQISKIVGHNLKHNFQLYEIPTLISIYHQSKKNLEVVKLHTYTDQSGHYYEIITKKEKNRVSSIFQDQLHISPTQYVFSDRKM